MSVCTYISLLMSRERQASRLHWIYVSLEGPVPWRQGCGDTAMARALGRRLL